MSQSSEEVFLVASRAIKKLVEEKGPDSTFPYDAIWSFADTDVPSARRMTPVRRLIKEGLLETTGQMTTAVSPARAGSPTREYRPGFRFAKTTVKPKSYHILVITDHVAEDGARTAGGQIFKTLVSKRVWGINPVTASRSNLVAGDSLVFYLGGKEQTFLGTAVAGSSPHFDKSGQTEKLFLDEDSYRIDLKDIEVWDTPKPIRPLLKRLSFIKNTEYWGSFLQGGIRKIDRDDFELILASEEYAAQPDMQALDLSEFLRNVDLSAFSFDPHSLPAPERIRLRELMDNVSSMRWQIPNFQRYFDWKKEDIKDLLESVFNDYYVGAFLLWKTEKESPLDLIAIKGVPPRDLEADFIILDGQQRMTALYYAIHAPQFGMGRSDNDRTYFYVDFRKFLEQKSGDDIVVMKDEEVSNEVSYERMLFPLTKLSNYDEWVNGLEDYLFNYDTPIAPDKVRSLSRVLEKHLKHMWQEFEIPYVVLPKTMTLQQVTDIFEKINTRGKRLDTFDLLIARLLKYGVQLRRLWDDELERKPEIARYAKRMDKINIYIFQTMSLLNHPSASAKKEDILNIYENLHLSGAAEFNALWSEAAQAIDDAIDLLENFRDGFGVNKIGDLPFSPMLPVLAALLNVASKKPDKASCYAKIKQWYWSAVFSNAYSSGADSQMTADYTDVTLWFNDGAQIPRVVQEARREASSLDLKNITSSSNAIYKGVFSLLAIKGAYDFETNRALELAKDNEKDHIFPKAESAGFSKNKNVWSILNMTWLSDSTNLRKLQKKPSQYAPDFVAKKYGGNERTFKEVLATHFIDDAAYACMLADDLDGFIAAREKLIKKEVRGRIGVEEGIEDAIEADANKVVTDLEEGIRVYLNRKLTEAGGEEYWKALVTPGVRERVKEKVAQRIRRHPATASQKLGGSDLLSFCDIMDYSEVIQANWPLFEPDFGSKREADKHFLQLKDYRNAIKHGRSMTNVERKQGEASVEWLYDTLRLKMS